MLTTLAHVGDSDMEKRKTATATESGEETFVRPTWKRMPRNPAAIIFGITSSNEILEGAGFTVSYNPGTDQGEETALVKGSKFLILLGDFREAYERLVPEGYEACLAYFMASNAERSPWSNE